MVHLTEAEYHADTFRLVTGQFTHNQVRCNCYYMSRSTYYPPAWQ